MNTIKDILDSGVLVVTIVIMAMDLEVGHLGEAARRKQLLVFLLVFPAALLPVLGYLLIKVLSLPAYPGAGILPLAAVATYRRSLIRWPAPLTCTATIRQ